MLRAIIFDFDGVIADTEPLHFDAHRAVCADAGIDLTRDEYMSKYLGLSDVKLLREVFHDHDRAATDAEFAALIEHKNTLYRARIADGLPLLPGVADLVRDTVARNLPIAICSGARRVEIDHILTHANLLANFPLIVAVDDGHPSKPDPAGYLDTLARLQRSASQLAAADCLVIEDNPLGLRAAKAAGMRTLAVRTYHETFDPTLADRVERNLTDVTIESLSDMMQQR